MADEFTISIENLSKRYGNKQALDHVNLTIPQGMFGLLGPNGAGKTTLMKILTTLQRPEEGRVMIGDIPLKEEKRIRRMIGYLPQDFSMYGSMSAYQALDYLAALSGLDGAVRKRKVPELLDRVNLLDASKVKVKAMSGGMKRRLGIAQAIIHDPRVIIVDEPTAGLDPEERVRFRNLLCEIARDRIVLLSTHIVGDIEATCEQIAVLHEGKIFYRGTVQKLLQQVEGKVYTMEVPSREVEKIKEQYLVTGILGAGGTTRIKLVAEQQPFASATSCEPDVEDAYLYLMHQAEGR